MNEINKLIQEELLKIIQSIENLTNHNQTDHNILYKALITLENENNELKKRIEILEEAIQCQNQEQS